MLFIIIKLGSAREPLLYYTEYSYLLIGSREMQPLPHMEYKLLGHKPTLENICLYTFHASDVEQYAKYFSNL